MYEKHRHLPQQEPSLSTKKQILSMDEKNDHLAEENEIKDDVRELIYGSIQNLFKKNLN